MCTELLLISLKLAAKRFRMKSPVILILLIPCITGTGVPLLWNNILGSQTLAKSPTFVPWKVAWRPPIFIVGILHVGLPQLYHSSYFELAKYKRRRTHEENYGMLDNPTQTIRDRDWKWFQTTAFMTMGTVSGNIVHLLTGYLTTGCIFTLFTN